MSGETDEHGYAKECEYSTGQWTRKAWSAYNYFHDLTPDMQERVYNHCENISMMTGEVSPKQNYKLS